MAPRILIFSIAMDANNLFYVKFIATFAPTFFGYIISILAIVRGFTELCPDSQIGGASSWEMVHCSIRVVDRATGYVHPIALSMVHMVDIYCSMGVGSEEDMLNQGPPRKWAECTVSVLLT